MKKNSNYKATYIGLIIAILAMILYAGFILYADTQDIGYYFCVCLGIYPVMFIFNFYIMFRKFYERAWIATKITSPAWLYIVLIILTSFSLNFISILCSSLTILFFYIEIVKNYFWNHLD